MLKASGCLNAIKVVVVVVVFDNDVVSSIVVPAGVATNAIADKNNWKQHI